MKRARSVLTPPLTSAVKPPSAVLLPDSTTAAAIGVHMARAVFQRRGDKSEAHLGERELAGFLVLATDLGAQLTNKRAARSIEDFLAWLKEYLGSDTFAEINCTEMDNLREMVRRLKGGQ